MILWEHWHLGEWTQNTVGDGVTLCQKNGMENLTRQRLRSQVKSTIRELSKVPQPCLVLCLSCLCDSLTLIKMVSMALSPPGEEGSVADSCGLCSKTWASLLVIVTWRTSEKSSSKGVSDNPSWSHLGIPWPLHSVKHYGDKSHISEALLLTQRAGVRGVCRHNGWILWVLFRVLPSALLSCTWECLTTALLHTSCFLSVVFLGCSSFKWFQLF